MDYFPICLEPLPPAPSQVLIMSFDMVRHHAYMHNQHVSYHTQGSQFVKVIKFQVITRFCPGQKGHSPGYSVDNFDTKDILNSQEYKTWTKLSQYNIEIFYILTFQVSSRFSAKFLVFSRFSHFLGQIPGHFLTWTDKIQNSRFSRFPGSAGNPVYKITCSAEGWWSYIRGSLSSGSSRLDILI